MRTGLLGLLALGLLGLLLPPSALPSGDPPPGPRGIAVLSSVIGRGAFDEEIETFVETCRLDLVVVDFSWITALWGQTDLEAVEELARRLKAKKVRVAAMYRPRAMRPDEADVRFARDEKGRVAKDHVHLCFADERSVEWGAAWGGKILRACPSIDRLVLYNVCALCRCERCVDGEGARHAEAFVRVAVDSWRKIRPGVRIGHVGAGAEYAEAVDFLWPFFSVRRAKADEPVAVEDLVRRIEAVREPAGGKPVLPFAKICWGEERGNRTEDIVAAIRALDEKRLGFVLWYYSWLLHPDGDRYDPEEIVRALGGDPALLRRFLETNRASAGNARQWIWFDSRESKDGPRLRVGPPGRGGREIVADADSVLLSHAPDVAFGRHDQLSVSLGDTDRVLLHFPLEKARSKGAVRLVLTAHLSETPPSEPFDLAVHRVTEAWAEASACWEDQVAFEDEPAAVFTVPPEDGPIEIDVTDLVRGWLMKKHENHGLLLRVAKPVTTTSTVLPSRSDLEAEKLLDRALAAWPWAATVEEAKAAAAAENKLVLAMVTAEYLPEGRTEQEDLLLSTVLSHPRVVRLATRSFVPVRVTYSPEEHTAPRLPAAGPDPLAALGTSTRELKAPALLVTTPGGMKLAAMIGIGTFDHRRVLRFLSDIAELALGSSPPPADRKKLSEPEASYWRAARLWREGETDRARELLTKIARDHSGEPWELKARLRLAFPDRLDLAESIDPAVFDGDGAATEVTVPVEREEELLRLATDYLLETQSPDGGWPVAERACSPFRAGVSTLAAHALLVRLDAERSRRKRRIRAALDRADAWLDVNIAGADPRTLNSFAAAYHLEYRLAALEAGRAKRRDVEVAIRMLAGGGLENGAWSYDRHFGENWTGGFGGWPETTKGRTHSMNTGLALLALTDARDAGLRLSEGVLDAGMKALLAMRKAPARWTYTWPGPRNFDEAESSIARAPLCEQALLRLGGGPKSALRKALDLFMEHRSDLRPVVKLSGAWLRPNSYAAYFYHFGYYHAARALRELGDDAARRDLARLRSDLLEVVEPDGTWVDYPAIGKPYGTAMALLVFDLTAID